jgi:hypothetical protein
MLVRPVTIGKLALNHTQILVVELLNGCISRFLMVTGAAAVAELFQSLSRPVVCF